MRSQTLRRFFAVYRMDVRLTVFHWSYLLLMVAWNGIIIAQYALQEDIYTVKSMFNFVLGFTTLLGLFMAGIQASRVQRNRFDLIEVTFPTGVEVALARWLATITTVGGLLIVPTIVALFLPSTALYPYFFPRILFLCVLAIAFISGLLWLVQYTVGIRRWMYPLFALIWVGGGFLAGGASGSDLPLPGANLLNFMIMNEPTDSPWGSLPFGQLPGLFVLFYVGLVALFAGVMMWRHIRRRFYRLSPLGVGLTAVALVMVVFSAVSYTVQVAQANQQVRDNRDAAGYYAGRVYTEENNAPLPYAVTRYDLTYNSTDTAQLSAAMDVINRGDTPLTTLTLSLHRQFLVADSSVPFTREGDTLTFTPPEALEPGETLAIRLDYFGALWMLDGRYGGTPWATNFTSPDGVNLTPGALWYPVPGYAVPNGMRLIATGDVQTLGEHTFPDTISAPSGLLDEPAGFRLTVENAGGLDFASNLPQVDTGVFESDGATWAKLVGVKNLHSETLDGIALTTSAPAFETVEAMVSERFPAYLEDIQRIFPDVTALNLLVLDAPRELFTGSYPATAEGLSLTLPPNDLNRLQLGAQDEYYSVGQPLVASLFGGAGSPLADNMALFVWAYFYTGGDADAIMQIINQDFPAGEGGRTYYAPGFSRADQYGIALRLNAVYMERGETVLFDILRRMNDEYTTLRLLSRDSIIEWIEAQAS